MLELHGSIKLPKIQIRKAKNKQGPWKLSDYFHRSIFLLHIFLLDGINLIMTTYTKQWEQEEKLGKFCLLFKLLLCRALQENCFSFKSYLETSHTWILFKETNYVQEAETFFPPGHRGRSSAEVPLSCSWSQQFAHGFPIAGADYFQCSAEKINSVPEVRFYSCPHRALWITLHLHYK